MSISQTAGTCIVPTLSRLVLGLAFLTAGFNKVFTDATFSAEEAAALQRMGIEVTPIVSSAGARMPQIQLASLQAGSEPSDDKSAEAEFSGLIRKVADEVKETGDAAADVGKEMQDEASDGASEAVKESTQSGEALAPSESSAMEAGTASSMYRVALLVVQAGWKWPKQMAMLAAMTEFVGGGLLLIGFLSRIWALGLAIAMGSAFYLTTMQGVGAMNAPPIFSENPFVYVRNIPAFNMAAVQLAFMVLAFGIVLTGPGPLSLDRLFFGGDKSRREAPKRGAGGQPGDQAHASNFDPEPKISRPI